jgi:hypothetical protein
MEHPIIISSNNKISFIKEYKGILNDYSLAMKTMMKYAFDQEDIIKTEPVIIDWINKI